MNNTKHDVAYIDGDIEADVWEININNANCLKISIGNFTSIVVSDDRNLEPILMA